MSVSVLGRAALGGLSALVLTVGSLAAATPAMAVDTASSVVISEVYGGGGNSGAPFNKDFVELFNRSAADVDLTGWSVQSGSAAGTAYQSTALAGIIPAGGFFLIAESGGATGAALPTADATGTLALSAASGKVALVSGSATPLSCGTTCSSAAGVVDFVGYGSANDAAGTATPALSNSTSAQRTTSPLADTGNNAADFVVGAPTPKAATTATGGGTDCAASPTPPACVPGTTTIQDVQGDGFVSTMTGQTVTKVPGVVTA